MREVIVHPSPEIWTEITEVEIPQPGPDDVVIKVVVAGSNVKGKHTFSTCTRKGVAQADIHFLDWLHLKALKKSLNSGDDIAGSNGTWIPISHMLAPLFSPQSPSYLSVVTGSNKYDEESIQTGIEVVYTMVGTAHTGVYKPDMVKQPSDKEFVKGDPEWVAVFFKYMSQMLEDGRLTGHPFDVIDGGLAGVGEGLRRLQRGQARGVKYVYKIGEVE
ncbi:hypothetical protein ACHAPF_004766 [Botrytis cinerea]